MVDGVKGNEISQQGYAVQPQQRINTVNISKIFEQELNAKLAICHRLGTNIHAQVKSYNETIDLLSTKMITTTQLAGVLIGKIDLVKLVILDYLRVKGISSTPFNRDFDVIDRLLNSLEDRDIDLFLVFKKIRDQFSFTKEKLYNELVRKGGLVTPAKDLALNYLTHFHELMTCALSFYLANPTLLIPEVNNKSGQPKIRA